MSNQFETMKFPTPLQSTGMLTPLVFATPGSALTITSMIVFIVIPSVLLSDDVMRGLFQIPVGPVVLFMLVVIFTIWAWLLVWKCRVRPGHLWPRIWIFFLALVTTAISVVHGTDLIQQYCLDLIWQPYTHAFTVACVAALLILSCRLLPISPSNSWAIRFIAPASLIVTLILMFFFISHAKSFVLQSSRRNVEQTLKQLNSMTSSVNHIASYDWSTMAENPEEAQTEINILKNLGDDDLTDLFTDRVRLNQMTALNMETQFNTVAIGFLSAMNNIAGSHLNMPSLSSTGAPKKYHPDPPNRINNGNLKLSSEIVSKYHQYLQSLLKKLDSALQTSDYKNIKSLQNEFNAQSSYKRSKAAIRTSWTDHWVVDNLSLTDALRLRLNTYQSATDINELLHLPYNQIYSLTSQEDEGQCYLWRYFPKKTKKEYHVVSCYSYLQDEDAAAQLHVELRMVYVRTLNQNFHDDLLPAEIGFIFPVPNLKNSDEYMPSVKRVLNHINTADTRLKIKKRKTYGVNSIYVEIKRDSNDDR